MFWLIFKTALVFLVVALLLQGVGRLVLDVACLALAALRSLRMNPRSSCPEPAELRKQEEQPVAILVPVPDEAPAAAAAIAKMVKDLDYENYQVFVSVCSEHTLTRQKLEALEKAEPRVHLTRLGKKAGRSMGVCLNRACADIREHENRNGVPFDIFVLHEASSELHPLALRYFNHFIPAYAAVQLPVYAVPDPRARLVNGVFLDGLAERYTRDLAVRAGVTGTLPLAASGAALSRKAMTALSKSPSRNVFEAGADLPTYRAGLTLRTCRKRALLLKASVRAPTDEAVLPPCPGAGARQPLAALDRHPRNFRDLVHERARSARCLWRWSLAGVGSLRPGALFFPLRDMATPLFHLLVAPAYGLVVYAMVEVLRAALDPHADLRQLFDGHRVGSGIAIALMFLWAWQAAVRVVIVSRLYGITHGLLTLLHHPIGHLVNFSATLTALGGMGPAAYRAPFAWRQAGFSPRESLSERADKNEGEPPEPRRLGEMLLDQGLISREQLQLAMRKQLKSGRKLGEVLVEDGSLDEEDLVHVLARQQDKTAIEVDPYATPVEILSLVPRSLAERYRVFPVGTDDDTVVLAVDAAGNVPSDVELAYLLGRPVRFHWTSSFDIGFAIAKAYSRAEEEAVQVSERIGQRLVRAGEITAADLRRALRVQKRTLQPLGTVLVEANVLTEDVLQEFLNTPRLVQEEETLAEGLCDQDDTPQRAAS